MKQNWYKVLAVILLIYTVVAGFLGEVPHLPILHETIRNLYFHVTMWFTMMTLFSTALVQSILYLRSPNEHRDIVSAQAVNVGLAFGVLGLLTGSLWAKYTWGAWWTNDPQLNGAAITILAYLAYSLLRKSIDDGEKKARIAAVYNIFAFVMMVVFIGIIPKFTGVDSLHPGKGGNPGFNTYDLDKNLRLVFYPAVLAWILLGLWILNLRIRTQKLNLLINDEQ